MAAGGVRLLPEEPGWRSRVRLNSPAAAASLAARPVRPLPAQLAAGRHVRRVRVQGHHRQGSAHIMLPCLIVES